MKKNTILLYHPSTGHARNYAYFWLPYSVLSIGSTLDAAGYRVQLIDGNLLPEGHVPDVAALIGDVIYVGVSAMTGHQIRGGLRFALATREASPNMPIVWGGTHGSLLFPEMLRHELVDVVVRGQGEVAALDLANGYGAGEPPRAVLGVSYKEDGRAHHNEPRDLLDKNVFPPYSWRLVDVEDYVRDDPDINTRTINYMSSQGCPYQCGFCEEVAFASTSKLKWTGLSAERVAGEIEHLVRAHRINGIKFYDANFFVSLRRVEEFCRLVIRRQLKIRWAASAHPALLLKMTSDQWALLRESGCSRMLVGLESGSQEVLDLIQKNISLDAGPQIARLLRDHGVIGSFTFVVGFPDAPVEEVERTLELGARLRAIWSGHEVKVHFYAPYPGTPLFQRALQKGFEPPRSLEQWADFDYYTIETPWVDGKWDAPVRRFNEENCPYLHL